MAADMSRVPPLLPSEAKAVVGLDAIYVIMFPDNNLHVCLIRHSDGQGGFRQTLVWKKADGSLDSAIIPNAIVCVSIMQVGNMIDLAADLQGGWPHHTIPVNKLWP